VTSTITVQAGARLELFTLNQFVMPLQTKPVQLNNGTLAGNGNFPSEGSTLAARHARERNQLCAGDRGHHSGIARPIGGTGNLFENSSAAGTILLGATNTYTANLCGSPAFSRGEQCVHASSSSILVNTGATLNVTALASSPWILGAAQVLGGGGTVNGSVFATARWPRQFHRHPRHQRRPQLERNVFIEVDKSLAQV